MKRTTLLLTITIAVMVIFGTLSASGQAYNTITAVADTNNLDYTNGNKVVSDISNNLHMVFASGGAVAYTTSADWGATWSFPVTLAQGSTPTVAADDFGNIGVAYSSGNQVYYVYRPASGGWSSPFQVTSVYGGREPSIAGFGNKMYLTWAGNEVYFTSFATVSPAAAANPENVTLHVICSTANYRFPSIAVANSGGPEPVVRVAYYSHLAGCSSPSAGVYVVQRPAGGALTWAGFATGSFSESYAPVNPAVSSVSLAANRLSGEFYLLYCFLPASGVRGLWKIGFAHGDTTTNTWNRVDYFGGDLTTPVIADVTAISSYTGGGGTAVGLFKTAYSAASYGTVVLKNGSWTGATPTFSLGIPKSYSGRNPHVIDFSFNDPVTGEYKGINLIYEYSGSGYYELRTDYFNWFLMF